MMKAEDFRAYVASEKSDCEATLTNWKVKLEENPRYAFEWCEGAMKAAAAGPILTGILTALKADDPIPMDRCKEWLLERLINKARYIDNRSNGQDANLMNDYECSVLAMVVEKLIRGF